jgi:hypothetical protein
MRIWSKLQVGGGGGEWGYVKFLQINIRVFCNIIVRFFIEAEHCGCTPLFMNGDTENACFRTAELSVGITSLPSLCVFGHIIFLRIYSGSCLENREYGRRDPSCWQRGTLCPQKLAITLPTSGGRSVGIVRSRTQTMEFVCLFVFVLLH